MADPHPERPHRTGAFWLDMLVAVTAVCISLVSLWVAVRSDRTQERLLAASVWPVLLFQTSDYVQQRPGEPPKPVVRFSITNAGVGPARVKWFDVYYRQSVMPNARAFLRRCCGARDGRFTGSTISNYMQSRVLAARETVSFLEVERSAANAAEYSVLDRERLKLFVRACYCSVLDECWLFDSRRTEPALTRECPKADTPLYQG